MSVVSKNIFDLLGNDAEEDDIPSAPKQVVKPNVSSKKRDEAPASARGTLPSSESSRGGYARGGRGDGNDAAFRDRGAGRNSNRARTHEEDGPQRTERSRGRGGRPPGGRGRDYDRHSGTGRVDTDKQVNQGWGSNKGNSEWDDERAGASMAQAEAHEDTPVVDNIGDNAAVAVDNKEDTAQAVEPEPEPEDVTKSFADYLAEKAHRAPVAELPEARTANEGSRDNKKWAQAKEIKKDEDDDYFVGGKTKNKNLKERKEKAVLDIEPRFIDPRDSRRGGDRGRGRGRGDRGGSRGDFRPERRQFGGPRGGANGASVNIDDASAFPSLGA